MPNAATNRSLGASFGKVVERRLNSQLRRKANGDITVLEFDNAGAIAYTTYPVATSRPSEIVAHWASLAPKKSEED